MTTGKLDHYLDIKPEVAKALAQGKAVVALESTIISHGMPYPRNVQTALEVERHIREQGAVPATIAILGGRLKVGLTEAEIEGLGQAEHVVKTSRRDIPFVVAKGLDGATTVASTMILAAMAGISVFATGGIGGVHRGAQQTFDISADLQELAHTQVAVVCAGAKSILDIGLTLEYLETQGVPVVGFGTDEMPAFYTRSSGYAVDYRVDDVGELACALKAKWDMGLSGGLIVANPIPEAYQMDSGVIRDAIEQALSEMEKAGVKGKESTPFLLARVKELTGGDSLEANIQLVYNNARVAARLAIALAAL
jgi:pseudouridylate synthase